MNALTKILMNAARLVNKDILRTGAGPMYKVAEFGDEHRGAGVYRDNANDEYRVLFVGDGEHLTASDYHTSDKQDALDTAAHCTTGGNVPVDRYVPPAEPVATEEETVQTIARPRPRGFHAQPSKLLQGLLKRAA